MGYVIVGLLWTFWLEWYTTKDGMNKWVWRERIFHTFAWPISLSVLLYELFKGLK